MSVPTITLNNNLKMPAIGLGTWQAVKGEVGEAVRIAIDLGYRHFDCALLYQNEQEIGEAIRDKIAEGVVKREDLFIVSKLWNTYHQPDLVVKGCRKTLKNFGLDYIDQYLIHWPIGFKPTTKADDDSKELVGRTAIFNDDEFMPLDENGKVATSDDDYVDTWKEMEKCLELGLTKSIGVSNFNVEQLTRLLKSSKVVPATNQVELHPYLLQPELFEFCKKNNIVIVAYCPLGAGHQFARKVDVVDNPTILKIAKECNKTPGQIILRFLFEYGVIPIPKSVKPERLKSNFAIFDFKLSPQQYEEIKSLDSNDRGCRIVGTENHKYYPF